MESVQLPLFVLMGLLEATLIAGVIGLLFWLRSRTLAQRLKAVGKTRDQSEGKPAAVGFDQYLRDEIIRNQAFIEQAAGAPDSDESGAGQPLQLRKQFLELELAAHASQRNPVEFCRKISEGIQGMIERWRPEAESPGGTTTDEARPAESGAPDPSATSEPEVRELHDTHDEEMGHLRQVINNQQDAMSALRARLKESEHEVEGMDSLLEKLDEFELQSDKLQQAVQLLATENARLKQDGHRGESAAAKGAERDPAQLSGLKNMVGKQQATIGSLQDLIRELAPEASKTGELQGAIAKVQHTNQELSGCVAVLEDENTMLRDELTETQNRLRQLESAAAEAAEAAKTSQMQSEPSSEEVASALEARVQELEALIGFKDAAIEELEKQLKDLQARYLAATGNKKVN